MSENCFCCWYRRALSIASAAWPPIAVAWSTVSAVTGEPGCTDRIVSDASTSAGVAIGTSAPVHPRLEKRQQPGLRSPDRLRRLARDQKRLAVSKQQLDRMRSERLRLVEDRARGLLEARLGNLHRPRQQPLPPVVGHADERDVDAEDVHDRARNRLKRRFERQALREGT